MNLYDKKIIKCSKCSTSIGEVDLETRVTNVVCKKCKNEDKQKESSYDYLNKRMIETELS